jgi:hypothetical protein
MEMNSSSQSRTRRPKEGRRELIGKKEKHTKRKMNQPEKKPKELNGSPKSRTGKLKSNAPSIVIKRPIQKL